MVQKLSDVREHSRGRSGGQVDHGEVTESVARFEQGNRDNSEIQSIKFVWRTLVLTALLPAVLALW